MHIYTLENNEDSTIQLLSSILMVVSRVRDLEDIENRPWHPNQPLVKPGLEQQDSKYWPEETDLGPVSNLGGRLHILPFPKGHKHISSVNSVPGSQLF